MVQTLREQSFITDFSSTALLVLKMICNLDLSRFGNRKAGFATKALEHAHDSVSVQSQGCSNYFSWLSMYRTKMVKTRGNTYLLPDIFVQLEAK